MIDKPPGMTSARVVGRARRILGAARVGHTGTLDPIATGALPLCLGDATKLAGYLLADDKAYEAEIELGVETDTLDAEGAVTERREDAARRVDAGALRRAMGELVGEIEQVPPVFSAVRQDGERLHRAARRGREVAPKPRRARVDAFDLVRFEPPRARVYIACGKGTYVRALARDVGAALGCGAHVTELRRLRAGRFDLSAAVPLADLTPERAAAGLIAPAAAVADLPAATVPGDRLRAVGCGQRLPWRALAADPPPQGWVRLLSLGGELLALARVEAGEIAYERVFPGAVEAAGAS